MANVFDSESAYVVNNNIGLGGKNLATAKLHIGPSNGKSSSAPLKFDPGTLLVTLENNAMEFDGSHLYITISGIRYQLDQQSGGGGVAWGSIQGTLSNQTDLQNSLNLKLNLTGGTLSGNLSLGGNKVTNLATPTVSTDAATKGYVDSIPAAAIWGNITGTLSNQTDLQSALNAKEPTITAGTTLQYWRGDKTFQNLTTSIVPEGSNLYFTNARVQANTLDSLAAPLSSLNLNSQKIVNLLDPASSQDAATKNYVDGKFPVSIANGGTGVSSAFSSGSIIYSDGSKLAQDNTNLFYDATHKVVSVGTNTPNTFSGINSAGIELDNTGGANSDIVQRVAGTSAFGTHFFASSNGTIASPTITTNNSGYGSLEFLGFDGTNYKNASVIATLTPTNASYSSTSMPGDVIIRNALRKQIVTTQSSIVISSKKMIGFFIGNNPNTVSATFQVGNTTGNYPGLVTTNGTIALVGTETFFTNDFKIGDTISVSGETSRIIATITDDTHLTTTVAFSTTASNVTYQGGSFILFSVKGNGQIGGYNVTPTAMLHLPAGTANATTAPLKLTSGTNLTTPEAGAMEWDGTNLYITQTSGPTRKTIAYTDGVVDSVTAGTGIFVSGSTGAVTITNLGVTSITGTANQVIASASIGGITLSTPQNIDSSATPTFGGITINGKQVSKRTTVADTNYNILTTDFIIEYTSLSTGRTATLPTAVGVTGQEYIIKDGAGLSGTDNITVATTSAQTIDGASTKVINTNYGVLRVYSNGTNWLTF